MTNIYDGNDAIPPTSMYRPGTNEAIENESITPDSSDAVEQDDSAVTTYVDLSKHARWAKVVQLIMDAEVGEKFGREYELEDAETTIGRKEGQIRFPMDPYISPKHATLIYRGGHLHIKDEKSLNGVFLKINTRKELKDGDTILIGRQIFKFIICTKDSIQDTKKPEGDEDTEIFGADANISGAKLVRILKGGGESDNLFLVGDKVRIGRSSGTFVFKKDDALSSEHTEILSEKGKYYLIDLASKNGTFLRVRDEERLEDGTIMRIGNQHLLIDYPAPYED